ncbi:MAG: hypothetical protein RIK00_11535 [Algiphilus sp.]|uniref:hypothetical protein n=1 Tax=Algiphilus sp. TaxID=1872431 RepID=UPI0032EFD226
MRAAPHPTSPSPRRAGLCPLLTASLLLGLVLFAAVPAAVADNGPALTRDDVGRWLALRMETAELQRRMAKQAGAYDDLPRAFAEQRKALLDASGYGAARFDAHGERIWGAVNALNNADTRDREQAMLADDIQRHCAPDAAQALGLPANDSAEQRAMIDEMRALGVPEAQLAKMQRALEQMPSAEATASELCRASQMQRDVTTDAHQRVVEATRRDWPAVRPWLDSLAHFEDWYAGNRSDPPRLR